MHRGYGWNKERRKGRKKERKEASQNGRLSTRACLQRKGWFLSSPHSLPLFFGVAATELWNEIFCLIFSPFIFMTMMRLGGHGAFLFLYRFLFLPPSEPVFSRSMADAYLPTYLLNSQMDIPFLVFRVGRRETGSLDETSLSVCVYVWCHWIKKG